jgi:hypothetical protein
LGARRTFRAGRISRPKLLAPQIARNAFARALLDASREFDADRARHDRRGRCGPVDRSAALAELRRNVAVATIHLGRLGDVATYCAARPKSVAAKRAR